MSTPSSKQRRDAAGDWKHLLSVGGLLGAIALVLLVGALLRTDDGRPSESEIRPVVPDDAPRRSAPPPAATPEPASRSRRDPLAVRVVEDLERIARPAWTRQLAAVCEPDNVRRWVAEHGSRPELYVLPVTIEDRACFRVCWGAWPSAGDAERARLPSAIAALSGGSGRVVATAEIVP